MSGKNYELDKKGAKTEFFLTMGTKNLRASPGTGGSERGLKILPFGFHGQIYFETPLFMGF